MKWFKITLKEPADDACRTVRHALEDAMLFGDASGVRLVVSSVEEADTIVIHLSPQFTAKAPQLVDQFSGEKEEVDPALFPPDNGVRRSPLAIDPHPHRESFRPMKER
jgi:hypothetical protein